jgi:hypothetical protein
MRILSAFVILLSVLTLRGGDPSETACTAKCGHNNEQPVVSETAKKIINDEYISRERELLDLKDDALQEAEEWLLDEEVLNEDIRADVEEGKERVHDLLDEVDTEKVVSDTKNIFSAIEEWFDEVDLDSARRDANAEISNLQAYIESYKNIKDDFVENNISRIIEDFVSLGSEYIEDNLGENRSASDESLQPFIDGRKKSSRGKRAGRRLKSMLASYRNQYQDDVDEKREHYEGLRDDYQENIDDFKAKKDEWREWARTWRIRNEKEDDPEQMED